MKNKVKVFPGVYVDKWELVQFPTLEITTSVPPNGCAVDCVFCPQRTLEKVYKGERKLSLENFKMVVDKLPQKVRITFAGFTEPWLNRDTTDMILYAHEKGHLVAVFTTGIGMQISDMERIKHIPFSPNPNGGFVLHLPDEERLAKHPITPRYIEVLEYIHSIKDQITNFSVMAMGKSHHSIEHIFHDYVIYEMWSRAGNLIGETILKPELLNVKERFKSVYHGKAERTCKCEEKLYHNVMLPNGDVALCCMDYGLEHIIGNIFTQDYAEIIPKPFACFNLCRFCENGVSPEDPSVQQEKGYMRL